MISRLNEITLVCLYCTPAFSLNLNHNNTTFNKLRIKVQLKLKHAVLNLICFEYFSNC